MIFLKKLEEGFVQGQFEYINVTTGEKFSSELSPELINKIAGEKDLDLEEYLARIDLDARLKTFLLKIRNIIIKIGTHVVKIGKFVLNLITDLAATYKNTVRGAVVGAAVGFLLMQVPLIGWILGPIALTTFSFIGSVVGLAEDLINMLVSSEDRENLRRNIISRTNVFAS